MKNIKYSEIFFSFQGEGDCTGQPAVWLRFFGCNLECSGFGQKFPTKPETYELPYQDFDASTVTRVEDLPVWSKGCDSSYSWAVKFKHLAHNNTVEELCDKLIDQLRSPSNPEGLFLHPVTEQETMLCFTGGEPMLNQPAMIAILNELSQRKNVPAIVNVETNGTRPISAPLWEYLTKTFWGQWHWSVSPKLFSVSGEENALRPDIVADYLDPECTTGCLKFVINGSEECWNELDQASRNMKEVIPGDIQTWVMPVGATLEDQSVPQIGEMCTEAMKRGYNVAARLQCYIYGNTIGK